MYKVIVRTPESLTEGSIVWINDANDKIFHSSKRFDTATFEGHDSNYLGKIGEIFQAKHSEVVYRMLKKTDRIFGVLLKKKSGTTNAYETGLFSSWEELTEYAEDFFEKVDLIKDEQKRKADAKRKWMERGRKHLKQAKPHEQGL